MNEYTPLAMGFGVGLIAFLITLRVMKREARERSEKENEAHSEANR